MRPTTVSKGHGHALLVMMAVAGAVAVGGIARAQTGWRITDTISPLTNAETYAASLESTTELLNQIGQPERAALVLRCSEGQPAFFVSWPQVLSQDDTSIFLKLPQTTVAYRLDQAPIRNDLWVISSSGLGAGGFDKFGAPKLIKLLVHAHRLVVRLRGVNDQDAVFELGDIDSIIYNVSRRCGLPLDGLQPPADGQPATTAAARAVLGVLARDLPSSVAASMHQPNLTGQLIFVVQPGSVAERSGLMVGDVLIAIGRTPTPRSKDMQGAVAAAKLGDKLDLRVFRAGEEKTLTAQF